jgi:hypothetical protein
MMDAGSNRRAITLERLKASLLRNRRKPDPAVRPPKIYLPFIAEKCRNQTDRHQEQCRNNSLKCDESAPVPALRRTW